jgi:hypothetical protein
MKQISGCVGKLNVADINASSTSTPGQIANQPPISPILISNFTEGVAIAKSLKAAMSGHYISSSG